MKWEYDRARSWAIWALAIAAPMWLCHLRGSVSDDSAAKAGQIPASNQSLKFESQNLELAEVRAGVPLTCHFSFTNTGPNIVEITELRPGCGCLRPRLQQQTFARGEHGTLPLELQTLGQPAGPHTWHLTIVYRDGDKVRELALQVKCTVVTEVSVQPTALTLHTQGTHDHEITVTDFRAEPLRILRVEATSRHLTLATLPFVRDDFGHFAAKVRVRISNDLPPGKHEEQIVIYTGDPFYKEFKIPVTIVKDATRRISAAPAEVMLDTTSLVRLRDVQDQPVVIENVTSDAASLSFNWASGPGNQATLRVTANEADLMGGSREATISVQFAGPVREVLRIPVHWRAK